MRAPHFLLAALVALATSFGLRAAAYRHHWRLAQAGYAGLHGPWGPTGFGSWRERGCWGTPPGAQPLPAAPAPTR